MRERVIRLKSHRELFTLYVLFLLKWKCGDLSRLMFQLPMHCNETESLRISFSFAVKEISQGKSSPSGLGGLSPVNAGNSLHPEPV